MQNALPPVAVVGLGLIGTSLAKRLIAAGFTVHGYDVDAARTANLEKLGGKPAASLRDAARASKVIVLSVFNTDQVEAVVEGKDDAPHLELTTGQAVVCTSTCDPDRVAALVARVAPRGIRFLEMPLSGNSDQIALGNGIGLVGGTRELMDELAPLLGALCKKYYFLGSAGAAGRGKLAVNLIGGLNRAVMAEGLSFAEAMGLELEAFLEVLKASAAYSRTMDNRGLKMIRSDYGPHAKLSQSRKDFALMQSMAERVGQELPLAGLYVELIESCLAHGEGDLDNSAVMKELRRRRKRAD
jgi:3-hydroxyisobutyrate dehydrogenase-like beta-hydroxyacid dehydrogenase